MSRLIRVGAGLALGLSLGLPGAGCGREAGQPGAGSTGTGGVAPAEPGQAAIPDAAPGDSGVDTTGNAPDVPVTDAPAEPGIGS